MQLPALVMSNPVGILVAHSMHRVEPIRAMTCAPQRAQQLRRPVSGRIRPVEDDLYNRWLALRLAGRGCSFDHLLLEIAAANWTSGGTADFCNW